MQVLAKDDRRELRARELASAAGLSCHIAQVFVQGRRRLHHVWGDLNAAGVYALWSHQPRADPLVSLSELSRLHIRWWIRALDITPERSLFRGDGPLSAWGPKSVDFLKWEELAEQGKVRVIECDASKLHGWSYHKTQVGIVVSGTWPVWLQSQRTADVRAQINFKELWVAKEALLREAAWLFGWRVVFRCV